MRHDPPDPLASRLARTLDLGDVSPAQAARLVAARRRALELAGRGGLVMRSGGLLAAYARPVLSGAVSMALVGAVLLASLDFGDAPGAGEFHLVDGALLVDDLPIDAYLDDGFRAWIAEPSKS